MQQRMKQSVAWFLIGVGILSMVLLIAIDTHQRSLPNSWVFAHGEKGIVLRVVFRPENMVSGYRDRLQERMEATPLLAILRDLGFEERAEAEFPTLPSKMMVYVSHRDQRGRYSVEFITNDGRTFQKTISNYEEAGAILKKVFG